MPALSAWQYSCSRQTTLGIHDVLPRLISATYSLVKNLQGNSVETNNLYHRRPVKLRNIEVSTDSLSIHLQNTKLILLRAIYEQ